MTAPTSSKVKIAKNTTAKVHGISVTLVITVIAVLLSRPTLDGAMPAVHGASRHG